MQYITTPHQAELNAAEVMKAWGFTDAVATTGGADGGIDVRSSRALAQVKWKGGAAGRPEMQQLYGARGTDTKKVLFFFAASAYSKAAIGYADEVGIGLFTYDPVGVMTPINGVAQRVISSGTPAATTTVSPSSQDGLFIGALLLAIVVIGGVVIALGYL